MVQNKYILLRTLLELAAVASPKPEIEYAFSPSRRNKIQPDPCDSKETLIERARSFLPELKLSVNELLLIAALAERNIYRERYQDGFALMDRFELKSFNRLDTLELVRKLLVKGVLEVPKVTNKRNMRMQGQHDQIKVTSLLEVDFNFSKRFIARVYETTPNENDKVEKPFKNNLEHLEAWFGYIDVVSSFRLNSVFFGGQTDEGDLQEGLNQIDSELEYINARLSATREKFPLQELIESEQLSEEERDLVLYLLKDGLLGRSCSIEEVIEFLGVNQFQRNEYRKMFDTKSKLVSRGIVEVIDNAGFRVYSEPIRLSPDVANWLCGQQQASDEQRITQILSGNDLFEIVQPIQRMTDLVLPNDLRKQLDVVIKRYECNVVELLERWGIDTFDSVQVCGKVAEPPLLILLCGSPGTGKTFAAGAIAHQLNKKLISTDISRVLSMWVGGSEQNVRRIFQSYEQIVRRCENPPVLLLNECDQFLTTRGKSDHSVDRMYNQMQNLFLEAFEHFHGILIATTNLADNLDSAFGRRFHLKLEFPLPDYNGRCALWKKLIPANLPLHRDVRLNKLAERFEFSGGQVSVCVRNAAMVAAVRNDCVRMGDLIRACETEQKGTDYITNRCRKQIGFRANS